ncbi:RHS repeat-associated core domain-containing protein [Phenylobacterium sp.]|uniref:RHS repeat-associated core domain-containing protein n=1 Tax=Phenylobacterium sp. TaxID=1871053 RepID=UPI002E3248EA|nr:RHS repeat-associated core domain-containing protein [Phenylobacterium sp.]HEX3365538.1 RHS repeat-associated core domain-containing protein [Phenylobacterium sp.]
MYLSCAYGYHPSISGCFRNKQFRPSAAPSQCKACSQAGDPIDLSTGDLIEAATDFETAGPHPLAFTRQYSFQSPSPSNAAISAAPTGSGLTGSSFGMNWSSMIDRQLVDSSGYYDTVLLEGNGFYLFAGLSPYTGGRRDTLTHPTSTTWTWTSAEGEVNNFTQLVSGHPAVITSIKEIGGHTLTFNYSAGGVLQTITDDLGRTATVTWTGGNVTHIAFPDGIGVDYAYSSVTTVSGLSAQNLTSVTRTQGTNSRAVTYHYEDTVFPNALTGITDERGVRSTTWTYDDANARVTSSSHAGGADLTTVSYNDTAMTRTVTDALGKQTVTTFAAYNYAILPTQVAGAASTHTPASTKGFTYDSNGYLTSETDENGNVTHYTYTSGYETSRTEAYGTTQARTIATTWNTTFSLPSQVTEPTRTTNYTFDTNGNVLTKVVIDTTSFTSPYSTGGRTQTWTYTYTTAGLLQTVTNPISGVTTYAYDTSGFLTSVTDPLTHVTSVTARNGRGKPTTIVDQNGVTTTLTYDLDDRVATATVNPGASQSEYQFAYTNAGDIAQITLPGGGYLQYTYNDARRLTLVTNDRGQTQAFTYDANGDRLTAQTKDASSTLTQQETATYDELGRMLQQIGAGSQTWTFAYDKLDNPVQSTDARSKVYGATFDALNRVIVQTDPESHTVHYAYDPTDTLNDHKDGRNLDTARVVDGFGRTIREASPDRGTLTYWYDAADHLTKVVDGDSVEVDYAYDVAGRLTGSSYPGHSAEAITYTYDATASGNAGVGRLTSVSEESGSTGHTYDAQGRVIGDAKTIQAESYAVGYAYDANGKVTQITLPSGRTITYTRAADGLVTGITTLATPTSTAATVASSVTYLPFGPLQSLAYGNGLNLTRTYDANYWISRTQVTGGLGVTRLDLSFGRDANGALISVTDNASSGRGATYGYTDSSRLNSATGPWGADTYTYDAAGNRTDKARTIAGTTTHETPILASGSNQVAQVHDGGGSTLRTLTYRTGGDLSQDAVTSGATYNYTYDARKRLIDVNVGLDAGNYGYDFKGQRVWRTIPGTPSVQTHYIFDEAGHLLAEHNGATGAVLREYIWLDDMPVAMIDSTGVSPATYYVHTGQLEEPQTMTDASQVDVWDAFVEPFGAAQVFATGPDLDFRLPGQFAQSETGVAISQNWNRDYDTSLGRYIEADTLGIEAGQNVYGYVDGDPLNAVDPEGTLKFWYFGNWGGPGWANGQWLNEAADYLPKPGDRDYHAPRNRQDACYEKHDRCIHQVYNSDSRKMCLILPQRNNPGVQQCDHAVSKCLSTLPWYGKTPDSIVAEFGFRSMIPNDFH